MPFFPASTLAAALLILIGCTTAAVGPAVSQKPQPELMATTTATANDGCQSNLAVSSGTPWRPSTCAGPAYTNSTIPASPVLNSTETRKIRTLAGSLLNIRSYTEPVYYSNSSTPLRRVRCVSWGCVGGTSAPLRGSEVVAPGSDGQLVIVDRQRRRTYEMWHVNKDADGTVRVSSDGTVTVGSMSVVDLDGTGTKTADGRNLNITGAGVSRLFGVIRAHEVRTAASSPSTAIHHALQVSLPMAMNCSRGFREPATKTDGRATSTACVQQGARVQLDPAYNCSSPPTRLGRAVCYAMQKYGAYVMDNNRSATMGFFGQQRQSWPTASADYSAAGITQDYQSLGLPITRLRVLARWSGH